MECHKGFEFHVGPESPRKDNVSGSSWTSNLDLLGHFCQDVHVEMFFCWL